MGHNSPLLLNDLQFLGGEIRLSIIVTQYQFKSMYFKSKLVYIGVTLSELGANRWSIRCAHGPETRPTSPRDRPRSMIRMVHNMYRYERKF